MLPTLAHDAISAPIPQTPLHSPIVSKALPRMGKVLCVLSDERLRGELEGPLVCRGAILLRARDIWHATTLAIGTVPDVIVVEISAHSSLPQEFFDGLRRNQKTAGIPVLALIDSARQEQVGRANYNQATSVMRKLSPVEEILRAIWDLMDARPAASIRRIDPAVASVDAVFSEFGQRRSSLTAKRLKHQVRTSSNPSVVENSNGFGEDRRSEPGHDALIKPANLGKRSVWRGEELR